MWFVDIASKKSVKLDKANNSLDPADAMMNYFPTVLPVQVGGYFWAFWTSRRSWGTHLDVNAQIIQSILPGIMLPGGLDASKKRIWVTAISPSGSGGDVSATGIADPSHPGFYLEGQSESGNVRAFATLAPCVGIGATCESGLDCCAGFCKDGMCTEEKPMCSKTNEKCSADTDCCPPSAPDMPQNVCLGGFCGFTVKPD
jgi:hypothetical protein